MFLLLVLAMGIGWPPGASFGSDGAILASRPGIPDRIRTLAAGDFTADAACFGGVNQGLPCAGPGDCPGSVCSGRVDLLVGNFEAQDISLFQADSSGGYVEENPSPFIVLQGPNFIATGDLNGDDRLDAAIVNRLGQGVSVRLSDPVLTFRATANLFAGTSPQDAVITDYNRDNNPDLAITSQDDDAVFLYLGLGNGEFIFSRTVVVRTADQDSSLSVGPVGIAAEDSNCDGDIDLVVSQRNTDRVVILFGNGNGTFQTPVDAVPGGVVGPHPTHIVKARLNDDLPTGQCLDDLPDLVVLLEGREQDPTAPVDPNLFGGAAVLLGTDTGLFNLGTPIRVAPPSQPLGLAAGELGLGAAGFYDLVITNFWIDQILLYGANGTGGFNSPTPLGPGPLATTLSGPLGVALLDRDGDGINDRIAVSNFDGYSLTLFDFDGSCTSGPRQGEACSIDQECCTSDQPCTPGVCSDVGALPPFVEVLPTSPLTNTQVPVAMAVNSIDLGIGDDLAVLSAGNAPTLTIFSAINDGFFFKHRSTFLPPGSGPTALALGDFSDDGDLDAAIALTDADGSAGSDTTPGIVILNGNGNGNFGPGVCVGGGTDGETCTADVLCTDGFCQFDFGLCTGGVDDGAPCKDDSDCSGGTCEPAAHLSGLTTPALRLLTVELNPEDADLDGIRNLFDNCPSLANPPSCFGGTNAGLSCTSDSDCPGGVCQQTDSDLDGVGDACEGQGDFDADGIFDEDDNCYDVYNPLQGDVDQNLVGDDCDRFLDLVALEMSPADQVSVFFGRPSGQFTPPVTVPVGETLVDVESGNFTGGDDDPDLLVTTHNGAGQGSFLVLAGSGSGTLTAQPPQSAGILPSDSALLDLNPDDLDLDTVANAADNCPNTPNAGQDDADGNGFGDACSPVDMTPGIPDRGVDEDGDLVDTLDEERLDNCPDHFNPLILVQRDLDRDGIGDDCDSEPLSADPGADEDGDGVPNGSDNCPARYNPAQDNFRGTCRGVPGQCVPCQTDTDCPAGAVCEPIDDRGDDCDSALDDPDGDQVPDLDDNCPDLYNRPSFLAQPDTDADGIGDACDTNACIFVPGEDQDGDGIANDGDGSGVPGDNPCHGGGSANCDDNCPTRYNPAQTDSSGYGVGDDCDEQQDSEPSLCVGGTSAGLSCASNTDCPGGACVGQTDSVLSSLLERDNCPNTYNPDQQDLDFNGIGDACENLRDVTITDAGPTPGEVLYFIQFPPGTWVPNGQQTVGNDPSGITVLDLNRDGEEDFVVSNRADSTMSALVGKGDGTFLPGPGDDPAIFTLPSLPEPESVFAGFFLRDTIIQDFPEVASFSKPLHNPITLVNVITERADTSGSGRVDGLDLAEWAKGFGLVREDPGYTLKADINLDGVIDGLDLVFITSQFGVELGD